MWGEGVERREGVGSRDGDVRFLFGIFFFFFSRDLDKSFPRVPFFAADEKTFGKDDGLSWDFYASSITTRTPFVCDVLARISRFQAFSCF